VVIQMNQQHAFCSLAEIEFVQIIKWKEFRNDILLQLLSTIKLVLTCKHHHKMKEMQIL